MYKYLETILDNTPPLSTNFDRMHIEPTSKLRRLYTLRMYFDSSTKGRVSKAMILPCITYNCNHKLKLDSDTKTKTADHRLISREKNWKKSNFNRKLNKETFSYAGLQMCPVNININMLKYVKNVKIILKSSPMVE